MSDLFSFVHPPLQKVTKLGEGPCTDFGTEEERRIIGGRTEAIMSLKSTVEEMQDGLFVRCEDAQRHIDRQP